MSTHRFIPAKRKGRGLPLLSMLGGLLITLQLLLTPTAFAASRASGRANVTAPLTTQGIVDLAGVSVVRLVISYKSTATTCTALGTIIASWPAVNPTDKNNWVLTDASMLLPTAGSCQPGGKLAGIQIYASSEYAGTQSPLPLDQLICSDNSCSDTQAETYSNPSVGGGILFSFHTDATHMQPFLGLAPPAAATSSSTGVELINSNGVWPSHSQIPKITGTNNPVNFLTPHTSAMPSLGAGTATAGTVPPVVEPGTPYVDSNGNVTGIQVLGTTTHLSVSNIQTLENQETELQQPTVVQNLSRNTLNSQWQTGMQLYEQGNYAQAVQTLQLIQTNLKTLNPMFQAAGTFQTMANQKLSQQNAANATATATANARNRQGNQGGSTSTSWVLIIGLVAGGLALVLLFLLVSLQFGRKRVERKRELESFDADVKRARQSVASKELPQQFAQPPKLSQPPQPPQSPQLYGGGPPAPTAFPQPLAPAQPQESYAPVAQNRPIADVPTANMPNRNGGSPQDSEITMPHDVRQLQGRNLGLVVVTETDPGIKRKHKPNEDSIFAAQLERAHNSQPQQVGLFVVADGMGGHANGQDASRLAIQTIIDYMIPRISTGTSLDDEGYKNLLVDGVQHANLAVHQRNQEEHGDMGTTMTAALVIGATAYIANVGDSRTYLYREPEGLRKITHDHSVVASLVDAGIIKPDDIYTHPKRNQIYRSLGEKPVIDVDSFIQPLQAHDKLMLCSDGLWDMVRDPDIQRVISTPVPNPKQTGKNLIQAALDGGGEDNVSVIVVSITDTGGHTGMTGINLHYKPDSVTLPDIPQT